MEFFEFIRDNENRYEKLGGLRNLGLKLKLCLIEWEIIFGFSIVLYNIFYKLD